MTKQITNPQEAPSKVRVPKLMSSTKAQLSRSPSQWRYEKERAEEEAKHVQGRGRRSKDVISSIAEFQYISRILKCTGIDRDTPVSLTTLFSPNCPLDPSIFHNLETTHYAPTTNDDTSPTDDQQCLSFENRRLIFNLVDEILADILKPLVRLKPSWVFNSLRHDHHQQQQQQQQKQQQINGFELVKMLCRRIRNIPCVDCQTLQDIDALVEKDLPQFGAQNNLIAFEEEGQAIVSDIEHDIVDSLIQEIAVFCLGRQRSSMQRYVTIIRV